MQASMKKIKDAIKNKNWKDMMDGAHTLKGASGYVGASRIHYACYFI